MIQYSSEEKTASVDRFVRDLASDLRGKYGGLLTRVKVRRDQLKHSNSSKSEKYVFYTSKPILNEKLLGTINVVRWSDGRVKLRATDFSDEDIPFVRDLGIVNEYVFDSLHIEGNGTELERIV